ncbi:MAG: hypothetical protein RLZZ528_1378 [Pseudomonadota bacterium]
MTTDRDMDDREGLAAEYVLGTLPLEDRALAERLIGSDTAFAAMVEDWTGKLAPLNDGYAEVAPPESLMTRVEARLFPVPARRPMWRVWLGGLAGAAAAVALAVAVLPPLQRPEPLVATLRGEGQDLIVAARFDAAAGKLSVRRDGGPAAQTGQDYQLWLIPAGQAPVPMGLIREGDLSVELAALPAGATLAVSLEPEGGSPTGQPTGPVLVAAVIEG